MTSIRVRVTRTDDGETLLERHLSTVEYLAPLKNTYGAGEPGQAEGESGDAYDLLIQADLWFQDNHFSFIHFPARLLHTLFLFSPSEPRQV